MIEKVFKLTESNEKVVEKVIMDKNIHYIHMIFKNGEGLAEHYSNSIVYMTVLRGKLSIQLNEEEIKEYDKYSLLKIPFNTKMNVTNKNEEVLELVVIKAPSPSGK